VPALAYFGTADVFHPFDDSWQTTMDYLVLTLYIAGLATVFFGVRGTREVRTSIVFSACMLYVNLLYLNPAYGPIGPSFWATFLLLRGRMRDVGWPKRSACQSMVTATS
jgi:hypothetical protein